MTVAALEPPAAAVGAGGKELPGLRLIVLARIACEEGATRPELARELGGYVGSGTLARVPIDTELAQLVRAGLATETRSRFAAAPEGVELLLSGLGLKALPKTWSEMRDVRLVAKALGIEGQTASRLKGLANTDVLRGEILVGAFGLKLKGSASTIKLRAALALIALERAFGNRIKGELTASSGLNAKASRVLAGQLLRRQRDPGTDKRLIAMLAAECVGSAKLDGDALRAALLKRLAGGASAVLVASAAPVPQVRAVEGARGQVAVVAEPARRGNGQDARPAAASRPDLPGFVNEVQRFAGQHADGWPGNRKALVNRVFAAIVAEHPGWGLNLLEFKAMLAECHRIGRLALVTADLKDKGLLEELRLSAITYKNTVWHLIRVEE